MQPSPPIEEEVIWAPQPGPQTWAMACPCQMILYGGARGGGKSDCILGKVADHCLTYGSGARVLVLRRTLVQLGELIERAKEIFPHLGAVWKEQKNEWHWENGALIRMRYLDRDADAENYQGQNNSFIAVDEAGNFPNPGPIDKIIGGTLRSARGVRKQALLTANPGGPGHGWLKARFLLDENGNKRPALVPWTDPVAKLSCVFIPSGLKDNKILVDNDPGYVDQLHMSGPAWLVKAWLDGDWDVQPAGGIIDVDRVNVGPRPGGINRVYMGVDGAFTKKTTGDETAISVFGLTADLDWWWLDCQHGRWEIPEVVEQILRMMAEWKPITTWIEGGPSGLAIEPWLRRTMDDQGTPFRVELVSHMHDKVAKAGALSAVVNAGRLWVPQGAAWWPDARDQLIVFDGEDGKADDIVDSAAIIARQARELLTQEAPKARDKGYAPGTGGAFMEEKRRMREAQKAKSANIRRIWER